MSIDERRLAEIEQRCRAASPGPWKSHVEGRDHTSGGTFIETRNPDGTRGPDIELSGATVADHDFIAHARQDVLDLVEEVRRLRRELEAQRGKAGQLGKEHA